MYTVTILIAYPSSGCQFERRTFSGQKLTLAGSPEKRTVAPGYNKQPKSEQTRSL